MTLAPRTRQHFTGLGGISTEIAGLAASETSGFGAERQGTTTRAQARDALLEDLEALSRTARALSDEVPGIENKFRIPRDNNDQTLLSAGRAAATDALPSSWRPRQHKRTHQPSG